jgi:hypothetical protein
MCSRRRTLGAAAVAAAAGFGLLATPVSAEVKVPVHGTLHPRFVSALYAGPVGSPTTLAFAPSSGALVFETATGEIRRSVGERCVPYQVRGTLTLVNCLSDTLDAGTPYFTRPTSSTLAAVGGAQPWDLYGGFGRYWLVGERCVGQDRCSPVYLNRETEQRVEREVNPDRQGTHAPSPPPVRPGPQVSGAPWDRKHPLRLYRGGRRPVRLSSCVRGCGSVRVFPPRVVWREGSGDMYSFNYRRGVAQRIRVPAALAVDSVLNSAGRLWLALASPTTGRRLHSLRPR